MRSRPSRSRSWSRWPPRASNAPRAPWSKHRSIEHREPPDMRLTRAYTDAPLAPGHKVVLDPVASAHLTRVLKLGPEAPVVVFNGDGRDYHGRIARAKKDAVEVALERVQDAVEESPLELTLAQCIARGERMDWVVQKATELGVAAIVPIVSERTEVRLDPERAARRRLHWRGVAIAACEQCGRARL